MNDFQEASIKQERKTILVVEDNPVERQLVGKILRNADFEVIAVDCGEVVLDTVVNYQPDLILLDALLPDIDGFDVCGLLRAHPKGLYIPIIMLTGLDDVLSINKAYEVGATDFFTKPINHSLLVHRIRYLLRARLIMDELRVSRQSLSSAQQVAKLGHWEINLKRNRFTISEEMFQLYQIEGDYAAHDAQILLDHCHPDDKDWLDVGIQNVIDTTNEYRTEHRIILDNGTERFIEVHMMNVRDESEDDDRILGISMDVTERKDSEREILRLAYLDRLTGLPNRSLLEVYLEDVIPGAHVTGNAVAILAIDLDLFNRINNSMGHSAGDAVLKQLTERLATLVNSPEPDQLVAKLAIDTDSINVSNKDLLVRLAADTFIIALRSVQRQTGVVERFADKVKALFKQPFNYRGQELFVTASIGIAFSESGSTASETLLQQADLALHEAKTQGRNEIREYSGDLVAKVSKHLSIQSDIRKALSEEHFQLYYQPKINVLTGEVAGFEALIRWQHPEKGLVPPDSFITIAEETGQIVEIGKWVLRTACQQMTEWISAGLVDCSMAVNVSARQFKEVDFVETVQTILISTGLAPEKLQLEITEGVLISNPMTEDLVGLLRRMGISIALDDFGTGFSSLSYITRFPIDTIKIDRCFISHIITGSEKAAIVSAVTNLSHSLGFTVVAEGVETQDELAVVKALGCDEVQGYLHCRPIPADEMTNWLKEYAQSSPKQSATASSEKPSPASLRNAN